MLSIWSHFLTNGAKFKNYKSGRSHYFLTTRYKKSFFEGIPVAQNLFLIANLLSRYYYFKPRLLCIEVLGSIRIILHFSGVHTLRCAAAAVAKIMNDSE